MAQTLTTNIVINAKTGNGFSQVGATLQEMGSIVNGLSQQLISFGKDSLNVYRGYEKSMKDAEIALSTSYGRGTQQLNTVMRQLDSAATEWAASTIFHTDDVANAISEAAHAGWDFDQIMSGIPAAMQLAQAGGLDLSQSVDYIVKATNAAGVGFEDLGHFIDLWAYAANSSASDIGEFGEAMLRMGSTMRFADNTEELMTLIAMTANAGSTGSEAGTLIRSSMMRLIAPTKKAKDIMAEFGATSEEVAEMMNDEALSAANAELAAHGFSAYDDSGNLKSQLEIYRELYMALGDIAGGFDNIRENEAAMGALSAIFPVRSITEALTLIRAAGEGYDGLYDSMMNGEAEGYGAYGSAMMLDTLDGKIETFNSKLERLKQLVGEELSDDASGVLGFFGSMADWVSGWDPAAFSGLVGGLEGIAAAGPGMIIAGKAFSLIGTVIGKGSLVGKLALATTALVAATSAIEGIRETNFENAFGFADIDQIAVNEALTSISEGFTNAYEPILAFRQAVDESLASYQTASSELTGGLLSKLLSGGGITQDDIKGFKDLGTQMHQALIDGINADKSASLNYFDMLFGEYSGDESGEAQKSIENSLVSAYQEAMDEAESIGEGLRNAMSAAFSDGQISDDEYQDILSWVQSYNDAVARAQQEVSDRETFIAQKNLMRKAQSVSYESLQETVDEIATARDELLAQEDELYYHERYGYEHDNADRLNTQQAQRDLYEMERAHNERRADISNPYNDMIMTAYSAALGSSDYGDAQQYVNDVVSQVQQGLITPELGQQLVQQQLGGGLAEFFSVSDLEGTGMVYSDMIEALGGQSEMLAQIESNTNSGNLDASNALTSALLSSQMTNGTDIEWTNVPGSDVETISAQAARAAIETISDSNGSAEGFFQMLAQSDEAMVRGVRDSMGTELRENISSIVSQLSQAYDFERILAETGGNNVNAQAGSAYRNDYAAYQLMYGDLAGNTEAYRITVQPEVDMTDVGPVSMPVEPEIEGASGEEIDVPVNGDTSDLDASIAELDGETIVTNVDGDTGEAESDIDSLNGRRVVVSVDGDISPVIAKINSIHARVGAALSGYAEGGRADTASIFGEAGPEWAIPEEHSQRTADLLNAARKASGFTWGDLIGMYGGLNANADGGGNTIVYSPTINANDASGVDQVLREDKRRLEKWFEEMKLRDSMEVYA